MMDCRKAFTSELLRLARQDRDIVAVTTDARGSVTLSDFADQLPEQFIECGIAEQNSIGLASGLAHSGKKVFCCGPASFYSARCLEQIKVDVAYSGNPVKIFGVSGGVAYGHLGATHHSLHDIAVFRTFPGMNVILPCDGRMTSKLVDCLAGMPEPAYIRVGRGDVPDVYGNDNFEFRIGKANQLLDGNDVTLIGTGETVWHSLEAGRRLMKDGIRARVLDFSCIKPFDKEALEKAARETGRIVTVEEHSIFGGLGSLVTEALSEHPVPVRILGIPDEYAVHGSSAEIYTHYGINADGIVRAVKDFVRI